MSEVIVVGVDNSETAKRAAIAAAKMATALGGELHVVSGFSDDRIEEFGSGSDRISRFITIAASLPPSRNS